MASTGGTLRIDHCEIVVGKATACIAVDGAACEISNSRLSSGQGVCVFWRPMGGSKLLCENSVFVGRCCIASVGVAFNESSRPDLLASLELNRNTWQAQKGLELMFGLARRRQLQVRAIHNTFGVDHLLCMFWCARGRRSFNPPDVERLEEQLPNFLRWQEQENIYPANLSFLSAQSPNQPLKMVKGVADRHRRLGCILESTCERFTAGRCRRGCATEPAPMNVRRAPCRRQRSLEFSIDLTGPRAPPGASAFERKFARSPLCRPMSISWRIELHLGRCAAFE